MKKITDLKENEVIHCPTKEEFKKIIGLNPKNDCRVHLWDHFKERMCYCPKGDCDTGDFGSENYYIDKDYTIHQAKDFLEPEFEWGEECDFRDNDLQEWRKGTFVGLNPNTLSDFQYVVMIGANNFHPYKQCRKLTPLTLKITKGEEVILEKEITEKEMEGIKNA